MAKNLQKNTFPFKTSLNLSALIKYWEDNIGDNELFKLYPTDHILNLIESAPELRKPINDLTIVKKHKDIVGLLMSAVMPTAMLETELTAALVPFNFQGFYATPGYRKLLPLDEIRTDIVSNMKDNDMDKGKIMRACIFILNKFYGTNIDFDQPILVTIPDKSSGLSRIYKVDMNTDFADVINISEIKPISPEIIRLLLDNLYDVDLWFEHINPADFEFQGFSICKLVDVTVEEMISSIKFDLLKKKAISSTESFESIQQKIRAIFNLPKLTLGLSFFDVNSNIISKYGSGGGWNSFMMPCEGQQLKCDYFEGSIYDWAFNLKKSVVIEDLETMKDRSHVENRLLESGIKNVAVAPMIYEDNVIGMLELGTPYAGKLNAVNASKLETVIPMFSAAVQRVLDEMETEVRAIIQEECTAIHPSVEWKFLEEGYKLITARNQNERASLGEIVFQDVYPIYGLSDIRNSSSERSQAIQQDLRSNLREVKKVINTLLDHQNMPILEEMNFRVDQEIKRISKGLNSGDESAVIQFLKMEIMPTFGHFKNKNEKFKTIIEDYQKLIDPTLGVIYKKRLEFEQSLTQINELISTYLDEVEEEAQDIFPHYFEKYKTDGVEYNIYMGQSMVKDKEFNKIYLNNFRLWQLITMCEIALKTSQLKEDLAVPLDITQLILVHGEPLSIKFRKDEKHFDVDGAYNIRYEIVKKRIDKALIAESNERLTQPGKIAIVYTQQSEVDEYIRYIKYLQSIEYLTDKVEFVNLEELQGAHGLKAIRVEVNMASSQKEFGNEVIKNVIESMKAN